MTGVSPPDLEAARNRLAAEREHTEARLAALQRDFESIVSSSVSAAGGDDEHDPEGSSTAFERQHVAALLDQARDQLAEITGAMQRLDDGSYGICERCGRVISAERLAARPAAVRCIACAASRRLHAGLGGHQAGLDRGGQAGVVAFVLIGVAGGEFGDGPLERL
jgi:DnaK suppressor protein